MTAFFLSCHEHPLYQAYKGCGGSKAYKMALSNHATLTEPLFLVLLRSCSTSSRVPCDGCQTTVDRCVKEQDEWPVLSPRLGQRLMLDRYAERSIFLPLAPRNSSLATTIQPSTWNRAHNDVMLSGMGMNADPRQSRAPARGGVLYS